MSVRVGCIGAGGIAASHLENLLRMPAVDVVALCDLSTAQIERTRQSVNRAKAAAQTEAGEATERSLDAAPYTDYRAMLRDERLDAVYLCLPPFAHGEPEAAVIAADLPMLVEKPVARDLQVAACTLKAIRERGTLAAVGYQLRYADYVQRARELLAGHTVGMAVVLRFGGTPGTPWYHRQDKSGGQMIEMATHQVDLLRYLVGEVSSVYSAAATRINHREWPDYDIFDVNCMTLTFENGAVASFACNFIAPHGSPPDARGVHIFCDGLTLSLGATLRAMYSDHTDEWPADPDMMVREDRAFIQAVAAGRPELIKSDYADAVRTLAVTVANDRSARSGQPVDVRALLAEIDL